MPVKSTRTLCFLENRLNSDETRNFCKVLLSSLFFLFFVEGRAVFLERSHVTVSGTFFFGSNPGCFVIVDWFKRKEGM